MNRQQVDFLDARRARRAGRTGGRRSGARSSPMRPPPLPVSATTRISRSCAASTAATTLAELPDVEIASSTSPLRAERAHLLGEHLLERIVVGDRRQQRRVGGKRYRRELRPLALEAADQLGGEVLRVATPSRRCRMRGSCRRRAGTRSSTPPARAIGGGHRFRRVVLQLRAVGEMSADALDVIDHCGRILAGCSALSFDIDDVATPIDARGVEALAAGWRRSGRRARRAIRPR